ncbi:hypothetical protein LTR64_007474 [Lithohypha guttulata]|uniref:Uncharacterized protein n=1 Tax=Lithohypha guttulata TaxID=1690604 RepID=A0AAN7T5M2_9EURO|nr:hypothetical protein LTR51_006760 [Lithohypha guttulata]KAK5089193.1 hypothetical protein LTR05_003418 [Lithohypha guttulata]
MVDYVPPPKDLSRLNVVQRYMQKGSLDWSDYLRLAALVLTYWFLRPYIMRLAKRWSDDAVRKGEEEQAAYQERRAAAAVAANEIRSGKKEKEGKTLGQLLDEGSSGAVASSGADSSAKHANETQQNEMKNRKQKKKGVSFAPEKSETDKTLDWEDESEFDPRRGPQPVVAEVPASGDIKQWMEKWTSD